jgi:GTPase SAR1 family protein
MIEGEIREYRIAVIGLQRMGKSSIIQRLCTNVFCDTPPTTTEQQSTAVWDNTFVFFWEFPTDSLTESTVESIIVGFGGILFVFELNSVLSAAGLDASKHYLVTVMTVLMALNVPLLLVGTMSDSVEELQDVHPSILMSALTENLKKTQLILTSAKDEVGMNDVKDWILARASPTQIPP